MSKIEGYIKKAVKEAAEVTGSGVNISNCKFDNNEHIHIDNGDAMVVLLELAKAQTVIAEVVEAVTKIKPVIENKSSALNISAIEPKAYGFYADYGEGDGDD